MNEKYKKLLRRVFPALRDVVGLDFGASSVKAVHIRDDIAGNRTVVAAAVLPPVPLNTDAAPLVLSKELIAWSAAMVFSSPKSLLKLVTPTKEQDIKSSDYPELLGLPAEKHGCRLNAVKLGEGSEAPMLISGVAADEVMKLPHLLPVGKPLPASAEIAGVAAMACYCDVFRGKTDQNCDLVIDAGRSVTTMAVFHKDVPWVMRQFPIGAVSVEQAVMDTFACDQTTAHDVLVSGEVDLGETIRKVFGSFLRQTGIAVDFSERRTGARLQRVVLTGGLGLNSGFRTEIRASIGVEPETLNPWQGMQISSNAFAPDQHIASYSFAAATSAAIAILEAK